jgi:predicted GNAT family acetyltransferase
MHIQQENNDIRGRFFINENGKDLAEMDYSWRHGTMVILHTEVDESLAGKGVGKSLVDAAVAYAREHKISILPICSYAKKVMERSPEYADILDGRVAG